MTSQDLYLSIWRQLTRSLMLWEETNAKLSLEVSLKLSCVCLGTSMIVDWVSVERRMAAELGLPTFGKFEYPEEPSCIDCSYALFACSFVIPHVPVSVARCRRRVPMIVRATFEELLFTIRVCSSLMDSRCQVMAGCSLPIDTCAF